jgi:hypothetical protein
MKINGISVAVAACVMLSACATNQKVAVNQLGDEKLSCQEIKEQDRKLDQVLEKAQHNKGVSTANVAAVILFWPAAVGNFMDADKAEELVNKRKTVLADMYKARKCDEA